MKVLALDIDLNDVKKQFFLIYQYKPIPYSIYVSNIFRASKEGELNANSTFSFVINVLHNSTFSM